MSRVLPTGIASIRDGHTPHWSGFDSLITGYSEHVEWNTPPHRLYDRWPDVPLSVEQLSEPF